MVLALISQSTRNACDYVYLFDNGRCRALVPRQRHKMNQGNAKLNAGPRACGRGATGDEDKTLIGFDETNSGDVWDGWREEVRWARRCYAVSQFITTLPDCPAPMISKARWYSVYGRRCVMTGRISRPLCSSAAILYQVSNIWRP